MEVSENYYQFDAVICRERYYDDNSNFGIYVFRTEDDIPGLTVQRMIIDGEGKNVCTGIIKGKMQKLSPNKSVNIKADFVNDDKYGEQYNVMTVTSIAPKTVNQKKLYLKTLTTEPVAEQLMKVDPDLIDKILDGTVTKDNFDYKPIKGLGKKTWEKLYGDIVDKYELSDLLGMLIPLGITENAIDSMLENDSPELVKQKIKQNPYYISEYSRFGFKRTDDIALKMKPEMLKSPERLMAFLKYHFHTIGNDGHTWCYVNKLRKAAYENVPECMDYFDEMLEKARDFHVVETKEGKRVGLKSMWKQERYIYSVLEDKQNHSKTPEKFMFDENDIKHAIVQAEMEQGFQYTDEQRELIVNSLNTNVAIISGCAGSGKSTVARGILKAYDSKGMSIGAAAPSAKAAQRITETTGLEASTIHRLLKADGFNNFRYNEKELLPYDVIFIDECSMINASLFKHLVEAIGQDTRLILMGDALQLPPIGAGNVFYDLLVNNRFTSFQLTKPMRQATDSGILKAANMIRNGKNPLEKPETRIVYGDKRDMIYMFSRDREEIYKISLNAYMSAVKAIGKENVCMITPRKQGCLNCSNNMNQYIQNALAKIEGRELITISNSPYANITKLGVGDIVIQKKNDYTNNVVNGEIGKVIDVDVYYKDNDKEHKHPLCNVEVEYNNEKTVFYDAGSVQNLNLAYAFTIHSTQGSEFPVVVGVLDNTHYTLLDNCMLYTMITRAKKKFLLVSEPKAYITCIRTNHNVNRDTWLKGFGQRRESN